jgi:hypothetical protein
LIVQQVELDVKFEEWADLALGDRHHCEERLTWSSRGQRGEKNVT